MASAERAAISRLRAPVRHSVTLLGQKVAVFCGKLSKQSDPLTPGDEVQIETALAQALRLEGELKDLNSQYGETLDGTDDAAIQSEHTACWEYMEKIDLIRAQLVVCKKNCGRYGSLDAPVDSNRRLAEAIEALVQLQTTGGRAATSDGSDREVPVALQAEHSGGQVGRCLDRLVTLQESSATGAVQLPPTKLTRFAGGTQDFLTFIDEFRRLVHDRAGLSDLQRHKILRDVLDGEAAKTVHGVMITEEAYPKALHLLLRRYGCVETIVYSVLTKLAALPKVQKVSDIIAMRGLVDMINSLVVTLAMLEFDEKYYSSPLYPMLLRAIPDELSVKFVSTIRKGPQPDMTKRPSLKLVADEALAQSFVDRFQQLREFLSEELATLEHQRSLCPRSDNRHTMNRNGPPPKSRNGPNRSAAVYAASGGSAVGGDKSGCGGSSPAAGAGAGRRGGRGGGGERGRSSGNVRSGTDSPLKTGECIFCAGEHNAAQCQTIMSVEERREIVKRKGACVRCLEVGHWARRCTKKIVCQSCRGGHYQMVCSKADNASVILVGCVGGLLPTGHVDVCDDVGNKAVTRFLLDSGSQRSFITGRLANTLQLQTITRESLYLHVFGGGAPLEPQRLAVVRVRLLPKQGDPILIAALVVDKITSDLLPAPSKEMRRRLQETELAERVDGPPEIGLLLNAADSFRIMNGDRCNLDQRTLVIGTRFGQVVVTEADGKNQGTLTTTVAAPCLERFFGLESLGVMPEELEAPTDFTAVVNRFKAGIKRLEDGRYQVLMNLRSNAASLDSNADVAARQLRALAKRLAKDPNLKGDYVREIRFFLEHGFAEPLPVGEKPKYLMPHFPVVQPSKESYRVRPVFNASAAGKGRLSLNDCIEDMPNLLPCPLRTLTNFWRYDVVWTGDISKAYLMVKVHPGQRNYLCFLWYDDDGTLTGETVYRMTSTSFGVKDSQHNTIAVIREHARLYESSLPEASRRLQSDLYMDDLLTGADTSEAAIQLWRDIVGILGDAGMTMKKFQTNCTTLRRLIGDLQVEADVLVPPAGNVKVLGVSWNPDDDVLIYCPRAMQSFVASASPTMRTLMGACARLYDPQGLLAPYVMVLKQILQDAHLSKIGLDAPLPPELLRRWISWCQDLEELPKFKAARCLKTNKENSRVELHAFADASERAYAAVVYVKATDSAGHTTVALVASKAKLTPLKQLESLTIPKKELMAATLAVRLLKRVKEYLEFDEVPAYLWSDAQVVLHWIYSANPNKWGVFVKNRLSEILQHTAPAQWAHCPGSVNPADLPSRGMSMSKLHSAELWFEGPPFLRNPAEQYPKFQQDPSVASALPEARVMMMSTNSPPLDPSDFSSLRRLIRVAAWVRRAIKRFREKASKCEQPTLGPLSGAELIAAKHHLLAEAQARCLGDTVTSLSRGAKPENPSIAAFDPFVDKTGLVRVGGRLHFANEPFETRHPVLLQDDPFTRLLIADAHCGRLKHMKTDAVMSELRQKFWIVRARSLIKSVINKCTACRRESANRAEAQEAPLPPSRVEMSFQPFKTTGVDYLGPLEIKTQSGTGKVWVALFTCAVIRTVHLEVVEDLAATSCLAAIRRFVALHGVPERIISENALTFKKANKCLVALWKNLKSDPVANYCGQEGIVWEFNIPRASWWGGFFERLVGVTKTCLRKMLGAQRVTMLTLVTLLHEVAAAINQRPLTRLPEKADEPRAITPAMFLAPKVPLTLPAGQMIGVGDRSDTLVKAWKQRERILNIFWKRWRDEYLLVLRTALRRRSGNDVTLAPGDIVLLEREGAPRAFWRLGRIEEVLASRDEVARSYRVHLGRGQYVNRPGKLLVKLL